MAIQSVLYDVITGSPLNRKKAVVCPSSLKVPRLIPWFAGSRPLHRHGRSGHDGSGHCELGHGGSGCHDTYSPYMSEYGTVAMMSVEVYDGI